MREILFRGKPKYKGDFHFFSQIWKDNCKDGFVYGSLVVSGNKYYICVSALCQINSCINNGMTSMIEVIPSTIGQYTGLTDKNGTKIFEGDIIRYTRTNMYAPSCSFHKQDLVSIHLVLWDSSVSAFVQQHHSLNEKRIVGKGSAVLYDDRAKENIVEVIGNIHDNPELLESEVQGE